MLSSSFNPITFQATILIAVIKTDHLQGSVDGLSVFSEPPCLQDFLCAQPFVCVNLCKHFTPCSSKLEAYVYVLAVRNCWKSLRVYLIYLPSTDFLNKKIASPKNQDNTSEKNTIPGANRSPAASPPQRLSPTYSPSS